MVYRLVKFSLHHCFRNIFSFAKKLLRMDSRGMFGYLLSGWLYYRDNIAIAVIRILSDTVATDETIEIASCKQNMVMFQRYLL